MDDKNLVLRLALAHAKGLGPMRARELLARLGSVEAVFAETEGALAKLGLDKAIASDLLSSANIEFAKKELHFLQANGVQVVFLGDKDYPFRLRECADAPVLFMYKGNCSLSAPKMLAVVGSRHATDQGKRFTTQLVCDLAKRHPDLVIVGGLAYGIDVTAHKAALEAGIPTLGVMATGLDRLYPVQHKKVASQMKDHGGLLTEHFRGDALVPGCFVSRNRIIAGLCDGVVVVESAADGGALTTADIANSYSREVFAVPGRPGDVYSEGCNDLIKQNKAALITSADDVDFQLGWDNIKVQTSESSTFPELNLPDLSEQELQIVSEMRRRGGEIESSELALFLKVSVAQLSSVLFTMEMRGLVHRLPGNRYAIGKK